MYINIDLRMGSEKHKKILSKLIERKSCSQRKNRDRMQKWEQQEKMAKGVIHLSEMEKKKVKGEKISYVSVQVPYSYGMMMSAHTYYSSVFLSRTPIFQYQGRHGESEQNETAVESLIGYQVGTSNANYEMYLWLYDACKYGLGVLGTFWETEFAYVSTIEEVPKTYLGMPIPGTKKKERVTTKVQKFDGNKFFNVQPIKFFFDPSVTPAKLQDGEWCGRFYTMSWNKFKQGAAEGIFINDAEAEQYFNLSDPDQVTSSWLETPDNDQGFSSANKTTKGFGSFMDIFVRLIPEDWELGSSPMPEIWVFTVIHGACIVRARPLGDLSNKYPFFTLEQEIEAYAIYRPGVMEQLQPYNDILTWLFNSHFYNVEQSLNNQFVYDPSRVMMQDVLDPQPGKRIRLTPTAYGSDTKTAISQLNAYDVTQMHMTDFDKVGSLMQRMGGVVDGIMGQVSNGGRKTATEIRTSTQGAVNRLKTVSEFMSTQGFQPLSQHLVSTTQQYYNGEMQLRVNGTGTRQIIQVSPEMIAGAYDFVPIDGTMPIDRFAQAQLYQELMLGLAQNPALASQFDFGQMATWIAKMFGMKSIDTFRVQQGDPNQMAAQVQAGNAIPQGQQV
jgi:hypothetical protein